MLWFGFSSVHLYVFSSYGPEMLPITPGSCGEVLRIGSV